MKPIEFHLNEFKAVAGLLDALPLWLGFYLKGWLKFLEERYIDAKASTAVSKAIREYNETIRTPEGLLPPQRHTEPSQVAHLDIISISSPWTSQSLDQQTPTTSTTILRAPDLTPSPKTTDSHP